MAKRPCHAHDQSFLISPILHAVTTAAARRHGRGALSPVLADHEDVVGTNSKNHEDANKVQSTNPRYAEERAVEKYRERECGENAEHSANRLHQGACVCP